MTHSDESEMHVIRHGLAHLRDKLRRMQAGDAAPVEAPMSVAMLSAAVPDAAQGIVELLVYAQDPLLGEPEMRSLPAQDVQHGLLNDRLRVVDTSTPVAEPDVHGSYLYWPGTPQFDQVNAFYYATFTLRMMERYAQRVLPWSFADPRLMIYPHMGNRANAFYNEQAQILGFHNYQVADQNASTAQSADIVSHETGHAVLDGIRDLWNESFGLGCRAMHESVGDMVALLVALHDDSLVQRVLKWTADDLRVTNVITEVAEHLAYADNEGTRDATLHTNYLRNAINPFVDQPFDTIPYDVSDADTMLSRQEHNYSRVFTGAFWDIFAAIYDELRETSAPFIAVTQARREVGQLLMLALDLSPVGELTYGDMACAFLTADQIMGSGQRSALLRAAFIARQILTDAEITSHIEHLAALPAIVLPESMPHMLAAAAFYEGMVAPYFGWPTVGTTTPLGIVRNAVNHTFLTFFETRPVTLTGNEYSSVQGAVVDMFGGVTLMFDADRQLRSAVYRPVNDEDVRQIQQNVQDLLRTGRITGELSAVGQTPLPAPKGLHVRDGDNERLVKYPSIVDRVVSPRRTLRDYLLAWRDHMAGS